MFKKTKSLLKYLFDFRSGIFIILLLALILRILSLDQSFWLDEAITALAVRNNSFASLITKFSLGDTHPPLYYLVLRVWSLMFGYSEISLRMPSVIFGIATVYSTYLIAKSAKLQNNRIYFLVASILLATSGLHTYYSQEARMYAMSTFLVSLTVLMYMKHKWAVLSIAILLLGMTDYLPLLILFPLWIYSLYKKNEKNLIINFSKAHIPFFCFMLIWFPSFLTQIASTSKFLSTNSWWNQALGSANIKELILVWVKFIIGRISYDNTLIYATIVVFVSFVFVLPLFKALKEYKKNLLFWLWLIFPGIIFFVGSFFVPGFAYFRLLFLLPSFYLLVAFGLSKLKYQIFFTIIVILFNLVFTFTYLFNKNYWREAWRGFGHTVGKKI